MALTEIEYGALASSEVMNNNFQYLDNRVSGLYETVISNQATTSSNIASINTNISNLSTELNKDIEELNTTLTETNAQISTSGMYVTTYINGSSWYKEYFSDSEKTTRVWLEQGGICGSKSSAWFLKPFSNANYTLTLGVLGSYYESGGITDKSTNYFTHTNGKGWNYNLCWYACGV